MQQNQVQTQPSGEEGLLTLREHLLIERALSSVQADRVEASTTSGSAPSSNSHVSHPYYLPEPPQPRQTRLDPSFRQAAAIPPEVEDGGSGQEAGSGAIDYVMADDLDADGQSKRGAKQLRETKRAQQNRAAQRAFRARKDNHIKELEDRLHTLEEHAKSAANLQAENYDLRSYVTVLQKQLHDSSMPIPAPPPSLLESLPIERLGPQTTRNTGTPQGVAAQSQNEPYFRPSSSSQHQAAALSQPPRPKSSSAYDRLNPPTTSAELELLRHSLTPVSHADADMTLLDVGCGPGSMTLDLASRLNQGHVYGIDIGDAAIEEARALAKERNVSNTSFSTANILNLAGTDIASMKFDVIHAHQCVIHIPYPLAAIQAMRGLLKPGGFLAIRDADMGTSIHTPHFPELDRSFEMVNAAMRAAGGNPDGGRHLLSMAMMAGFPRDAITLTMGNWCFSTPEERTYWAETWASRLLTTKLKDRVIQYGGATPEELEHVAEAWKKWMKCEDGIWAASHFEIIAKLE